MEDLKTKLIIKAMEYELKIKELEEEYKRKNADFNERKMKIYINRKIKQQTDELLKLNINPALELLKS